MVDSLDTSLLVRYYTNDDPVQRAVVVELLDSGRSFFVPVSVVLELVWVLDRVFHTPRKGIVGVLRHLLALDAVQVEDDPGVESATQAFDQGLDFADALHLTRSRRCERLLTFDRKFAGRATRLGLRPACEALKFSP